MSARRSVSESLASWRAASGTDRAPRRGHATLTARCWRTLTRRWRRRGGPQDAVRGAEAFANAVADVHEPLQRPARQRWQRQRGQQAAAAAAKGHLVSRARCRFPVPGGGWLRAFGVYSGGAVPATAHRPATMEPATPRPCAERRAEQRARTGGAAAMQNLSRVARVAGMSVSEGAGGAGPTSTSSAAPERRLHGRVRGRGVLVQRGDDTVLELDLSVRYSAKVSQESRAVLTSWMYMTGQRVVLDCQQTKGTKVKQRQRQSDLEPGEVPRCGAGSRSSDSGSSSSGSDCSSSGCSCTCSSSDSDGVALGAPLTRCPCCGCHSDAVPREWLARVQPGTSRADKIQQTPALRRPRLPRQPRPARGARTTARRPTDESSTTTSRSQPSALFGVRQAAAVAAPHRSKEHCVVHCARATATSPCPPSKWAGVRVKRGQECSSTADADAVVTSSGTRPARKPSTSSSPCSLAEGPAEGPARRNISTDSSDSAGPCKSSRAALDRPVSATGVQETQKTRQPARPGRRPRRDRRAQSQRARSQASRTYRWRCEAECEVREVDQEQQPKNQGNTVGAR